MSFTPQSRDEPMLDPEILWRIGPNMNVVATPPPARKITREGKAILDARRAGNRGRKTNIAGLEIPKPRSNGINRAPVESISTFDCHTLRGGRERYPVPVADRF